MRNVTPFLERTLFPWLLPSGCLGCGGTRDLHLEFGLCLVCRGKLRRTGCACPLCGRRLQSAAAPRGYRCGRCRKRPPRFDRLVARWLFEPPIEHVIHGLKFGRLRYLGEQLAKPLAHALRALDHPDQRGFDSVVAVPLHWRRRLARGYNQAEEIARALADELSLPLLCSLRRTRQTSSQTGLPRAERSRNLRGAFRARRPTAGRILLVDDVVTTGTTMDEAAGCLRRAGAAEVTAVAVARTPRNRSRSSKLRYISRL